jgi:hypothetical protein
MASHQWAAAIDVRLRRQSWLRVGPSPCAGANGPLTGAWAISAGWSRRRCRRMARRCRWWSRRCITAGLVRRPGSGSAGLDGVRRGWVPIAYQVEVALRVLRVRDEVVAGVVRERHAASPAARFAAAHQRGVGDDRQRRGAETAWPTETCGAGCAALGQTLGAVGDRVAGRVVARPAEPEGSSSPPRWPAMWSVPVAGLPGWNLVRCSLRTESRPARPELVAQLTRPLTPASTSLPPPRLPLLAEWTRET